MPQPPSYEGELARSVMALRQWAERKEVPDDDAPEKLIYPLEHAYTPAELSFAALKGVDAAVSAVLVGAAPQAGCDLHLALVSIEESGIAEHTDYYPSRRRWRSDEEDDEFEIVEVSERTATLSSWHRPDGGQTELGALPFEDDELCPPDALAEMEPDELYFQEATGNEGASFARTYRRAALVLWPQRRWLAVLAQTGLRTTLPYLAELTRRWEESDKNAAPARWEQAHELSGHMLRLWPRQHRYSYQGGSPGDAATMLRLSTRLHDADSIDAFLATITAAGLYGTRDNEAILMATRLLRPERTAELLERIIAANETEVITRRYRVTFEDEQRELQPLVSKVEHRIEQESAHVLKRNLLALGNLAHNIGLANTGRPPNENRLLRFVTNSLLRGSSLGSS